MEDNIIGITKNLQSKIFDLSYRASNMGIGFGSGLYIDREIINKLKDTI